MRVAIINQPLDGVLPPDAQNSIGIWTYETATRLAQTTDVHVFAKRMYSRKESERIENGVHYHFVRAIPNRLWGQLDHTVARFFRPHKPFYALVVHNLEYILQVARQLQTLKPDIIHIPNYSQFVPVVRAFNPQAKIVLHMQCEWLLQLDATMLESRLRQTDMIVNCSEYISERTRQRFPQFSERNQTVFNGVDLTYFEPLETKPIAETRQKIVFIGRVSPERGVHVLLEAFEQVIKTNPQADLIIVGPTEAAPFEFLIPLSDDEKMKALAPLYGPQKRTDHYFYTLQAELSPALRERVTFTGGVSHDLVRKFYQEADVFVFPSVCPEPFGIPLVEAMACQVPVVATNDGGVPEIISSGQTGLLVERANASELATAIRDLLNNPNKRREFGQQGRMRVEALFSWEHSVQTLLEQYKTLLAENSTAQPA